VAELTIQYACESRLSSVAPVWGDPAGQSGPVGLPDEEDFRQAVALMARYSKMHDVRVHGWCLMHNHGHWILEASTEESISNLMRDMQGRYSFYLNRKYRLAPWLLLGPLEGGVERRAYSDYRRAGPVNCRGSMRSFWMEPVLRRFCDTSN
jgi:hypothetical protein